MKAAARSFRFNPTRDTPCTTQIFKLNTENISQRIAGGPAAEGAPRGKSRYVIEGKRALSSLAVGTVGRRAYPSPPPGTCLKL